MRQVKLPIPDNVKTYFFEEDKTGDGRFMLTCPSPRYACECCATQPPNDRGGGGNTIASSLCQVASLFPPPPPAVNYVIIIIRLSPSLRRSRSPSSSSCVSHKELRDNCILIAWMAMGITTLQLLRGRNNNERWANHDDMPNVSLTTMATPTIPEPRRSEAT